MSEIILGQCRSLGEVPFHKDGPLQRFVCGDAIIHEFSNVEKGKHEQYCEVHSHSETETVILTGNILMRVQLSHYITEVSAPAKICIDAFQPHALNIICGTGSMVVIKN